MTPDEEEDGGFLAVLPCFLRLKQVDHSVKQVDHCTFNTRNAHEYETAKTSQATVIGAGARGEAIFASAKEARG